MNPAFPSFRETCLSGAPLFGIFANIAHPAAIEIIALGKPDFICIDGEHSQIGRGMVEDLLRAADLHGVAAMVRVPGSAPEAIAGVLDAGAKGIMVPMVSTAEQARAVVSAARYPPLGRRGVGPGRASGYGYRIPDYLETANRSVLVSIQVENAEGLANIGEIAAVEGVDVIFIGPGDLQVSLGALATDGRPALDEAITTIAATCRSQGRTCGVFRPDTRDLPRFAALGLRFFILASDAMHLTAAVSASMEAARASLSAT